MGIDNQQKALIATSSKPCYTQKSLYVRQSSPFPKCPTESQHKKIRKTLWMDTKVLWHSQLWGLSVNSSSSLLMLIRNSVYLLSVNVFEFCCSVWRSKKEKVEVALGKAWETCTKSEEKQVANENKTSPKSRDPASRNLYRDGTYFQTNKKITRKYVRVSA